MIYTTGYTGIKIEQLIKKVDELDAFLVDVRLSPWSRNKNWGQSNLIKTFKEKYIFGGKYFGNLNYKFGIEHAKLKDFKGGLSLLAKLLTDENQNIIFMCMCRSENDCHRKIVAQKIRDMGVKVEALDYSEKEEDDPNTQINF